MHLFLSESGHASTRHRRLHLWGFLSREVFMEQHLSKKNQQPVVPSLPVDPLVNVGHVETVGWSYHFQHRRRKSMNRWCPSTRKTSSFVVVSIRGSLCKAGRIHFGYRLLDILNYCEYCESLEDRSLSSRCPEFIEDLPSMLFVSQFLAYHMMMLWIDSIHFSSLQAAGDGQHPQGWIGSPILGHQLGMRLVSWSANALSCW